MQNLTRCEIFISKSTAFSFLKSNSDKIFYECESCVCLTFGNTFLVTAFFMAIEFLRDVMAVSFALPIDQYISLEVRK